MKEFGLISKRGFDLRSAHRNDGYAATGTRRPSRSRLCVPRPRAHRANCTIRQRSREDYFSSGVKQSRAPGGVDNRHSNTPKAESTTSGTATGKSQTSSAGSDPRMVAPIQPIRVMHLGTPRRKKRARERGDAELLDRFAQKEARCRTSTTGRSPGRTTNHKRRPLSLSSSAYSVISCASGRGRWSQNSLNVGNSSPLGSPVSISETRKAEIAGNFYRRIYLCQSEIAEENMPQHARQRSR
jgi:hypothetical protein